MAESSKDQPPKPPCTYHTAFLCFDNQLEPIAKDIGSEIQSRIQSPRTRVERELKKRGVAFRIDDLSCDPTKPQCLRDPSFNGLLVHMHPSDEHDPRQPADPAIPVDRVKLRTDRVIHGRTQPAAEQNEQTRNTQEIPDTLLNEFEKFIREFRESTNILYRMRRYLGAIFTLGTISLLVAATSTYFDYRADIRDTPPPAVPTASLSLLRSTTEASALQHEFRPNSAIARNGHKFWAMPKGIPDGHQANLLVLTTSGKVIAGPVQQGDKLMIPAEGLGVLTVVLLSTQQDSSTNADQATSIDDLTRDTFVHFSPVADHPPGDQYTDLPLAANEIILWNAQAGSIHYSGESERTGPEDDGLRLANSTRVQDWIENVINNLNQRFGSRPEDWSISGMTFRLNDTPENAPETQYSP